MSTRSPFGLPRGDDNESSDGNEPSDDSKNLDEMTLSIRGAKARPAELDGEIDVQLDTTRGEIILHFRPVEGAINALICVGGAGGGASGPADKVYERLSAELSEENISTVRVEYREAGEFEESVLDTLAAGSFLKGIGAESAILVGHSFGGAVAVRAAGLSDIIRGVIALSSQRFGTAEVDRLHKPLLLIHGSADDVLDKAASEDIFQRASEPKILEILEGEGHGLAENPEVVFRLIKSFVLNYMKAS